jgi:GGDEF-like domain/PucR C-terminal helix-turn-helix domain
VSASDEVVRRLRARRAEIEDAIFTRVRSLVSDRLVERDAEYVAGLRAAVAAAVDYALSGIERGLPRPLSVPTEVVVQARRAARSGVSLDMVLRRYIVGHALLWDYVMQETDRAALSAQDGGLRELLHAQAALLEQLVMAVTREHVGESARASSSREGRRLALVRALLDGEQQDESGLDYELDAEHVAVIATGAGAEAVLRRLAQLLDRRLLCVTRGDGAVWAWFGGHRGVDMRALERAVLAEHGRTVSLALGEPARGIDGWRLSHEQAQAALAVALRRPRRLTCYAEVALLATALKDQILARSLIEIYCAPLADRRTGGQLHETLRAYFAADRNVSSTAASLGVARSTIESRLRAIQARLRRPLHSCLAQLEVAVYLWDLDEFTSALEASPRGRSRISRSGERDCEYARNLVGQPGTLP